MTLKGIRCILIVFGFAEFSNKNYKPENEGLCVTDTEELLCNIVLLNCLISITKEQS